MGVVLPGKKWPGVSQTMGQVKLQLGTLTKDQGHLGVLSPKHLTPWF